MKQTILFVAANPPGTSRLALDEEYQAIEHELRLADHRDDFDFLSSWAVGVDELMRCLNQLRPTVLHFSGHGALGPADIATQLTAPCRDIVSSQGAGILLQDRHDPQYLEHRALVNMLASIRSRPRVVVLAACHSAAFADELCEAVECVIGLDGAIADATARQFSVGFYRAIGHRCPVGEAVTQARAALQAKQLPGEVVSCHTRPGVDANELYLSGPVAVEPRTVRQPQRVAVRAISQSIGSGAWPAAAEPYDLYLAHPPANRATASALYELLDGVRVFVASRSLSANDRREQAISTALRSSCSTVLLISRQADAAWYLGDEIIAALELHRATAGAHRLLPVLLDAGIALPRCFGDVEPIVAPAGDLHGVATRLRELVPSLPRIVPPRATVLPASRASGDHFRLYERLRRLNDVVFEQIMARAKIDRSAFAPRTAELDQRVLDIAQLAALDPKLAQRLSTELDRRALWTR